MTLILAGPRFGVDYSRVTPRPVVAFPCTLGFRTHRPEVCRFRLRPFIARTSERLFLIIERPGCDRRTIAVPSSPLRPFSRRPGHEWPLELWPQSGHARPEGQVGPRGCAPVAVSRPHQRRRKTVAVGAGGWSLRTRARSCLGARLASAIAYIAAPTTPPTVTAIPTIPKIQTSTFIGHLPRRQSVCADSQPNGAPPASAGGPGSGSSLPGLRRCRTSGCHGN